MKNQGRSYDNIASGFAEMRTEFATEQASIDDGEIDSHVEAVLKELND